MKTRRYQNFDLLIKRASPNYRAHVFSSPMGEAEGAVRLPFTSAQLDALHQGNAMAPLYAQTIGRQLFEAVFQDRIRTCLWRSLDKVLDDAEGLRLRLRLTDAPELAALPWEMLYDPDREQFFGLSEWTPIVRYLELPNSEVSLIASGPLHILAVIANPNDLAPQLKTEAEWEHLHAALQPLLEQQKVTLARLQLPTLKSLQDYLRQNSVHILHFVGHGYAGTFDSGAGLVLEDRSGRAHFVSAFKLKTALADHRPLRLAFLNACSSAQGSRQDLLAGVSQQLVQQGLPAVIGIQSGITDASAATLAENFYGALVDDYPIDAALTAARKALFTAATSDENAEWCAPLLFMRTPDGHLFQAQPAAPAASAPQPSPEPDDLHLLLENYLESIVLDTAHLQLLFVDQEKSAKPNSVQLTAVYTGLDTLITVGSATGDSTEDPIAEDGEQPQENSNETARQSVVSFVNEHAYTVLLGDPGSGKTTFANFLALCLAGERLQKEDVNLARLGAEWQLGPLLPLLISARLLAVYLEANKRERPDNPLWAFVVHRLQEPWQALAPFLADHLLTHGGLLIIDSLDEAPTEQYAAVEQAVMGFRRYFPRVRFLLTSRVYAYRQHHWRLPDFAEATLAPLSPEQINTLVDKLFAEMAPLGAVDKPDSWTALIAQFKINLINNPGLITFAERPFLLTLLATLQATHSSPLPLARVGIYEEIIRFMLERWEASKGAGLSAVGVRTALEKLAYDTYILESSTVVGDIPEETVLVALFKAIQDRGTQHRLVLEYICDRAGLLLRRGDQVYAFPHRTIQEYLAACYLARQEFPKRLLRLVRQEPARWREVFLLAGAKRSREDPTDLWYLLDRLCPRGIHKDGGEPATNLEWSLALLAGQLLVETQGLIDSNLDPGDLEAQQQVKSWLLYALQQPEERPLAERITAGDLLGELGDVRSGIGVRTDNGLPDVEWLLVEPSPFVMGSDISYFQQRMIEKPYSISRYPITVAQYQTFINVNGYHQQRYWTEAGWAWRYANKITGPYPYTQTFHIANHPQVGVCWYEAVAFCHWLTHQSEQPIMLPTEFQWERAARHTNGRVYPWGDDFVNVACNSRLSALGHTTAVGLFPQGAAVCGAADMAGNVWEWCRTAWRSTYADYTPDADRMLEGETRRVLRGGSFANEPKLLRCFYRHRNHANHRANNVGFRVVKLAT